MRRSQRLQNRDRAVHRKQHDTETDDPVENQGTQTDHPASWNRRKKEDEKEDHERMVACELPEYAREGGAISLESPVCCTTSVCAPNFGFHLDTATRC